MKPSIALGWAYQALATIPNKTPKQLEALQVLDLVQNELDGDLDDLDEAYSELQEFEQSDETHTEEEEDAVDSTDDLDDPNYPPDEYNAEQDEE